MVGIKNEISRASVFYVHWKIRLQSKERKEGNVLASNETVRYSKAVYACVWFIQMRPGATLHHYYIDTDKVNAR